MQTIRQRLSALREQPLKETFNAKKIQESHSFRVTQQVVGKIFYYAIACSLSFVFLYPMFYMLSQSLMTAEDVIDATVQWIPKGISLEHFEFAWAQLRYVSAFFSSVVISLIPALIQVLSCAIVGYGLARYRFPGYSLVLALVLFTFLVPPQTIAVPLFMQFSNFFGFYWIDTYFPFMVPAALGHGLRGALFVLIFLQFFRKLPNTLEEAARIDGAGAIKTFWSIMYPLAKPAIIVVFLFSVVWHWNDIFHPNLYLHTPDSYNLSKFLAVLEGAEAAERDQGASSVLVSAPTTSNRVMAGSILLILPILLLYLFTQRYFVESVERTGIAGE